MVLGVGTFRRRNDITTASHVENGFKKEERKEEENLTGRVIKFRACQGRAILHCVISRACAVEQRDFSSAFIHERGQVFECFRATFYTRHWSLAA